MRPQTFSHSTSNLLAINSDLFRCFGVDSADYRLYPAPDYFIEAFDVQTYLAWLGHLKSGYLRRSLSLYPHVPFCSSLCFFCHCNQIVSQDSGMIESYLNYLTREIRLQGQYFKNDPRVEQIVQKSIHRIQTEFETLHAIHDASQAGFKTVRVELIFGLPNQMVGKLGYTLGKIITASPDQICLSNYNYSPEKYKPQRQIDWANLLGSETKHDVLLQSINQLLGAGYIHIGMNHYAQKGDSLALAQRRGRLHHGLQGYSVYLESDHIVMGISAIGSIGPTLSQNHCDLTQYYDRIEQTILPIMRGIELSADDLIRRFVMQVLICHFVLIFESVETFSD